MSDKLLSPPAKGGRFRRFLRAYSIQIGITGVALFVWLIFLIGSPATYLAGNIYTSYMITTPDFALVAIPLTFVIITGEIDLSFGSIMAFGMTAYDLVFLGTGNIALGFVACLFAGILAGFLNGYIVTRLGIPSLVTTIGTQFFWRGAVLVLTNGQGLGMSDVQQTILYPILVGKVGGVVPMQFIWTIIFAVIGWFLLNRHKFGAHVFLSGDNRESASLMGVNVGRTKIIAFSMVGFAAAFAGFVVSAKLLFFWPTMGQGDSLLYTLASVFLGGTSVFGGTGTVYGTFIAAYIIGSINAGIVAAGLTGYWTQLIYGVIIVASIGLQSLIAKRIK